jgi:surface-anchored protein
MGARLRVALLAGASALSLTIATPAQAAPLVVLDKGHVDVVDVAYEEGGLHLHIHDETVEPGEERDPADVLLRVLAPAKTTIPADPAFSFLGRSGDPVWILPQVENPDLLFAGLSTEELEAGVFAGDQVTLKLCAVYGPGKVSVFTTDAFGSPAVVFNSRDGLPDTGALPVAGHQHANWSFTAAGTYRFVFSATGKLAATGAVVSSAPVTVTFKVLNP